jgi:hypothetical protein
MVVMVDVVAVLLNLFTSVNDFNGFDEYNEDLPFLLHSLKSIIIIKIK